MLRYFSGRVKALAVGCCEHGNKPSGATKDKAFLEYLIVPLDSTYTRSSGKK
jgi:hypothetical protein